MKNRKRTALVVALLLALTSCTAPEGQHPDIKKGRVIGRCESNDGTSYWDNEIQDVNWPWVKLSIGDDGYTWVNFDNVTRCWVQK